MCDSRQGRQASVVWAAWLGASARRGRPPRLHSRLGLLLRLSPLPCSWSGRIICTDLFSLSTEGWHRAREPQRSDGDMKRQTTVHGCSTGCPGGEDGSGAASKVDGTRNSRAALLGVGRLVEGKRGLALVLDPRYIRKRGVESERDRESVCVERQPPCPAVDNTTTVSPRQRLSYCPSLGTHPADGPTA